MIHQLLKEVEGLGCVVSSEMKKLKLHDPRPITNEIRELLKKNKSEIIKLLDQQEKARKEGWIVYHYGEVYEKQISLNSFVYLFLEEDGTYTAWRGTWREVTSPYSQKIIIQKVDFETAYKRANNYIEWFHTNTRWGD